MTDRDERFWRELTATRRQAAAAEERELAEAERALAETGDGEELGEDRIEAMARAAEALAAQEERVADAAAVPPRRWTPARLLVAALVVLFAGNLVIAGVQLTSAAFRDVALRRTPETVRYQEAIRFLLEPRHEEANRRSSQALVNSSLRWTIGELRTIAAEDGPVGFAAAASLTELRSALHSEVPPAMPSVAGDPTRIGEELADKTLTAEKRQDLLARFTELAVRGIAALRVVEAQPDSEDVTRLKRHNAVLLDVLRRELP